MARPSESWTPEQRERHGEVAKESWAKRRQAGAKVRRFRVRNTVHIFKECEATLDVLRARFESLHTQLLTMDANQPSYAAAAVACLRDAEIVRRAQAALVEVIELKESIEVELSDAECES